MKHIASPLILALAVAACGNDTHDQDAGADGAADSATQRSVALADGDGNEVGTIDLVQEPSGLMISLDVAGISAGMHAVHLHETGDCSAGDFTSAGGHWNPEGKDHGRDNPGGAHLGDLANLMVEEDGSGSSRYLLTGVTLAGAAPAIDDDDGTALVIHAGPDDYRTDPAGDAGDRVACAVISVAS